MLDFFLKWYVINEINRVDKLNKMVEYIYIDMNKYSRYILWWCDEGNGIDKLHKLKLQSWPEILLYNLVVYEY